MALEVSDRVHVAPMGYEEKRVYEPAKRLKADRVIIVGHIEHGPDSRGESHRSNVREELEDAGIDHETQECDIFDMYQTLGKFSQIITEHENDEVFVNVATGSKISAIAGMIACMATQKATPFYVRAHSYETKTPSSLGDYIELPRYPIDPPAAQEVEVLNYLKDMEEKGEKPSKGSIIHFGEQNHLPFITESDVQDKGKYRQLDTHIIEPLQERGYIVTKKEGRKKVVEITDRGKEALIAFGYLLENGDQELAKV